MEYDASLGMDWLPTHHAHVGCHQKRVIFKMKGIPEFIFKGVKDGMKTQIISAMKAKKLLRLGCRGFLAAVIDKKEAEVKLGNIAAVNECPNVFLEELAGIPRTERLNSLLIYSQDQVLYLKVLIKWL